VGRARERPGRKAEPEPLCGFHEFEFVLEEGCLVEEDGEPGSHRSGQVLQDRGRGEVVHEVADEGELAGVGLLRIQGVDPGFNPALFGVIRVGVCVHHREEVVAAGVVEGQHPEHLPLRPYLGPQLYAGAGCPPPEP